MGLVVRLGDLEQGFAHAVEYDLEREYEGSCLIPIAAGWKGADVDQEKKAL